MPVSFRVKFDATGPMELFQGALPASASLVIRQGASRAALRLQDIMRQELDRLVYSTPESPLYQRTHTLWRATYAARPGANHDSDHEAAFSGIDLASKQNTGAFRDTTALARLQKGTLEAEVEVGSWADWSYFVHEGLGHNPGPRRFTIRASEDAPNILREEINKALFSEFIRLNL